jgi:squalene-hopene/tetraprenyl-beta-curcumene cyclase
MPEGRRPWDAARFPHGLHELRERLRYRVLARIDADGAIRDPCRSRVLESALGLRAVQRVGGRPLAERRLIRYLEGHRDAADPLDRLLARAAIDRSTVPDPAGIDRLLDRVPGFASTRKRATLTAILCALGVTTDLRESALLPDPGQEGVHPWARVQSAADRIVLAVASGRSEQIRASDVAILDATQHQRDVWESNLLVHLCAVHALSLLRASPDADAAGVDKALRYQRFDGGLPFVSDVDTWCTATGAVALAGVGAPPGVLHSLARHLVAQQHPDGGWSFSDRVELCDTDDAAVALEFLAYLDPVRYRDAIDRGLGWLRGVQAPDGGFPTYPGAPSEPCMTVAAVNALMHRPMTHGAAARRAMVYAASRQHADGSFPPDWSASRYHTLFRTALAGTNPALAALPSARQLTARTTAAVRTGQNPDGGWGQQPGLPSDPISTAYALIALTRQDDPGQAVGAMRYLLSARDGDGTVAVVPDSIGPRPFPFAVPALADIFVLLALGHVAAAGARPLAPVHIPIRTRVGAA